jgi:NhaP-type Na+/H+ or K+/H+ antiporter
MKNKNAVLGMIFGAGIGIIFSSTGLGLPLGAGVGYVLGLMLTQMQNKKEEK